LAQAKVNASQIGAAAVQTERAGAVQQLPGYALGQFSVQDAAAQLAAPLLLDGLWDRRAAASVAPLRVLDACAAPGGKTGHLLEYAGDRPIAVTALEIDAERAQRIGQNLARLKLQAHTMVADAAQPNTWWDGQAFDAILLDAPCTGSGIVRRHPDIRWLRRASDIDQLRQQQAQLLAQLWPLVRPGGRLLYCTCSVFRPEGSGQIDAFLARNTDAALLPSPGHLLSKSRANHVTVRDNVWGEHDGFYYALLAKHL
jgi:16S rRNA (cytosine967-C5)-methyltransferase